MNVPCWKVFGGNRRLTLGLIPKYSCAGQTRPLGGFSRSVEIQGKRESLIKLIKSDSLSGVSYGQPYIHASRPMRSTPIEWHSIGMQRLILACWERENDGAKVLLFNFLLISHSSQYFVGFGGYPHCFLVFLGHFK